MVDVPVLPPEHVPDAAPVPPPPPAPPPRRRRHPTVAVVRGDRLPLRGATLAAAAGVGAMVGFGLMSGASLGRLGVVMLRLRGLPEFVAPDRGAAGAALLGGVHVALLCGAWGAAAATCTAALARRGVGWPIRAAALAALAAAVFAVDRVLPTPLRLAAGSLAPAELALVALLTVTAGAAAGWRATS